MAITVKSEIEENIKPQLPAKGIATICVGPDAVSSDDPMDTMFIRVNNNARTIGHWYINNVLCTFILVPIKGFRVCLEANSLINEASANA